MTTLQGRLDQRTMIILGAALGGTLLLAITVWLLVISPKRSQASDLGARIEAAEQELQSRVSHGVPGSPAGVSVNEARALERALPGSARMSSLVRQLDRLARQAGVTLETVTPQAETGGAGYKSLPLTVVVNGKFFGIRKFLRLLRTAVLVRGGHVHGTGRLFDVQAIDLQQSDDARPSVRATLTMEAFVFAPGTGAPGAATPVSASAAGAGG